MMQYMAVTNDKYELPFACADTPTELARLLGISRKKVSDILGQGDACTGRYLGYRLIRVEIEDYIDPLDELEDNKE